MNFHRWLGATALAVALGCSHAQPSAPRVALVQPSGPEVPANLLRFSIQFEAQVEGPMLRRLALLRGDGMQIQEPFLEQELWSPDGKLLTVLMHPGRVKSGLIAHDERGPILSPGEDVTLTLDGHPIKQWRVGPANTVGPAVSAWKISAVRVGSRQPIVVTLDEPIDGRDADYLAIADERDRRVAGRAQLANGESTWTFVPNSPWRAGAYKLVARGTLEDPAGNRLGSHFETSILFTAWTSGRCRDPIRRGWSYSLADLGPTSLSSNSADGAKMMSTITTREGVEIFYKDWGSKNARPIVFHHGWPLSADDWDTQMLYFLDKGYRVIAHDRRGHGRSTQVSDGHDMDHYAADAAAVVAHLDLRNAVHIGHSTGGGEATRYVAKYGLNGNRVAKLVLIGAVPPIMVKTAANPGGLPIEVFDGLRKELANNRAQFYLDFAAARSIRTTGRARRRCTG